MLCIIHSVHILKDKDGVPTMGKIQGYRSVRMLLLLTGLLLLSACAGVGKPQMAPVDNGDKGVITQPVEPAPVPEPPAITAPLTGIALPATAQGADSEAMMPEQLSKQRPIAVMINNYKAARPQSGLTHADIVWEVLAEGGITRLVAIFQSDNTSETIGPIRSIRPYLIEMGEMYNAVLVHAGASNDGYAILQQQRKQHLDEISNAGPFFWRESFRKAPHNLYSNLEKMRAGAEQKKYPQDVAIPAMKFISLPGAAVAVSGSGTNTGPVSGTGSGSGSGSGEALPSASGGAAQQDIAGDGAVRGTVAQSGEGTPSAGSPTGAGHAGAGDQGAGRAASSGDTGEEGSTKSTDVAPTASVVLPGGETAKQLEIYFSLKNYRVSYTYDDQKQLYYRFVNKEAHIDLNNEEQLSATNLVVLGTKHRTLDDVGRLSVDLDSGGPAMLFQQGRMVDCEWARASDDIIRLYKDGQELPFIPGKTYYHIVPLTPSFEDHVTYG